MRELLQKRNVKKWIALVLFLALIWQVFVHLTYLFRNADANRIGFLSMKEEKRDTIDMVYIGASCVMDYWDPMAAWKEYGFTSYSYAMSSMPPTTYLPLIKMLEKEYRPRLFAVDLRTFFSDQWNSIVNNDKTNGGGFRGVADSLDMTWSRADLIRYSCKYFHSDPASQLSAFLDLCYYHNNYRSLASERNWQFWNNTLDGYTSVNKFKGFWTGDDAAYVAMFRSYEVPRSEVQGTIDPQAEKCIRELLDYCANNDIDLVFTVSPSIIGGVIGETRIQETNTLAQIANEYNVPLLNYNSEECWKETQLDPTKDFMNGGHVNILGSEKYTHHLGKYIKMRYGFPSHQDSSESMSWDALYENEYLPRANLLKKAAETTYLNYEHSINNEKKMQKTNDFREWIALADDPNMTLLIGAQGKFAGDLKESEIYDLRRFGIEVQELSSDSDTFLGVYSGKSMLSGKDMSRYEGATVTSNNPISGLSAEYSLEMDNGLHITVNGEESFHFTFESGGGV